MFDVLVVGGGPVGACLGALLAGGACAGARGLSVAVLEPRLPAPLPADAALEARVVALSRASEHLLRSAGAWRGIAGPRLSAYERMRIWHESVAPDSEAVLGFDAADVGEPHLGYIVENRLLQGALLEAFTRAGGHPERGPLSSLGITDECVKGHTPGGGLAGRPPV